MGLTVTAMSGNRDNVVQLGKVEQPTPARAAASRAVYLDIRA